MKQLHYLALTLLLISSPLSLSAMQGEGSEGEEKETTQQGSGQTPNSKTLRFTEFTPGQKCGACGYTAKPTPPSGPRPNGTSRNNEEEDDDQKSFVNQTIKNPAVTFVAGGAVGAAIVGTYYFLKHR